MKKYHFPFLFISLLLTILSGHAETKKQQQPLLPRIAIAGIGLEASVFSPALTHEKDFNPRYGADVIKYYPFFRDNSGLLDQAIWLPTLIGKAMPGGVATRAAYESLVSKTLFMLQSNLPLDAIYFDIHGAMSVQGVDDPEGDFIARIREVVGTNVLISTSMDLHGSVTPRLLQNTDLITCYRMAPHEDAWETKQRAVVNLLARLKNGNGKPKYKALVAVPIMLPGEQTSTRVEPGKSLYEIVPTVIEGDKVIDASIWMSYPWGDQRRNHGVIAAYGDDKEAVKQAVEKLANYYWSVRKEFDFVAPTFSFEEAIRRAMANKKKPFIISDTGDNPTGGGAGDVTWTITELLKIPDFTSPKGRSWIYASIPGKEFIEEARKIGVGGKIDAMAGAAVDHNHAGPVRIAGIIQTIHEGHPWAKTEVVVKTGNSYIIVTEDRMVYHHEKEFTDLGLDPRKADILVLKQGYLEPEIYNMRGDWVMALTPGGVDQDLFRLNYRHIQKPIFPLDPDMADPDLSARFIPSSDVIKWEIE